MPSALNLLPNRGATRGRVAHAIPPTFLTIIVRLPTPVARGLDDTYIIVSVLLGEISSLYELLEGWQSVVLMDSPHNEIRHSRLQRGEIQAQTSRGMVHMV